LLVNDSAENIGTLGYRLSSNLYGYALHRAKELCSVCVALNLLISGREEVEFFGIFQTKIRATRRSKTIMLVFVVNKHGKPLMPCSPKVIRRTPFTIKLLYGSSGYKQAVTAGMDTGSKIIGCGATANAKVMYQAEIHLRQDISKNMQQRAMYSKTSRARKRYRPARWANRASMRAAKRLAPSVCCQVNAHLREQRFVEAILPVNSWKVATASFDIHKISNPQVSGVGYQHGLQKDFYKLKAFILHRDNYTCQSNLDAKHVNKLHVHHIIVKSQSGSNTASNLITLCEYCHYAVHNGKFELKAKRSIIKQATQMAIIKNALAWYWDFQPAFGYETKFKREQILKLLKAHYYDALAICCEESQALTPLDKVLIKKHVAKGDYQQTKGAHSQKILPTGKLFGLRKFALINPDKGLGFVPGKRSSGYFALMNILGTKIFASVNIKKNMVRITSRTTTLTQLMEAAIPLGYTGPSILAKN
jgi:5-methylcytosine-specific restriction endonuclease McrA